MSERPPYDGPTAFTGVVIALLLVSGTIDPRLAAGLAAVLIAAGYVAFPALRARATRGVLVAALVAALLALVIRGA